jgi:serine/threonine-protein kinase
MPLAAGTRVGRYEILDRLGTGGMSEVYRARDLELGREVAVKALPEAWGDDPERVERFEREAQLLAALRHPNIAVIHGLERDGSKSFLVLELIPGESLADMLARGPLPYSEARPIFLQIAQALEAAHEKGIIHRDLKPANAQIQPDGTVKLLDFGLGKDLRPQPSRTLDTGTYPGAGLSEGVLIGTPAYMSPEQVRRRSLGKATDIWSFGVTLFEALSGKSPFGRDTLADTLSAILSHEPSWGALPRGVPRGIVVLLERCLRKDERHRLHDIADARIEIEEAVAEEKPPRRLPSIAAAAAAAATLAWIVARMLPTPGPAPIVARFVIDLPATAPLSLENGGALAVSPDGGRLAYAARAGDRKAIYMRPLGQLETTLVPGTEGAEAPFFSPRGEWLGFFASGRLSKLSVLSLRGDSAIPLAQADAPRGSSWSDADFILFAPSEASGIARVSAAGGPATPVTELENEERGHRWPAGLAGDKAVFTVWKESGFEVELLDTRSGKRTRLVENASSPRYAPTGHLVFARGRDLYGARIDSRSGRLLSEPAVLVEDVAFDPRTGAAFYDFSSGGDLFYVRGAGTVGERMARAFLVTESGEVRPLGEPKAGLQVPRFAPDGRSIVMTVAEDDRTDLWSYDLTLETLTRLTFEGNSAACTFFPDGRSVAFASDRGGAFSIYRTLADGSGDAVRITEGPNPQFPTSVSPDGKHLAYTELHPESRLDVFVLSLDDAVARPFVRTDHAEAGAVFSPDGQFLAYTSDESGAEQVYVRRFPGPSGRWQVSTIEGTEPVWSRDGSRLFFRSGNSLMVADVRLRPEFESAKPSVLFDTPFDTAGLLHAGYDTGPDGTSFVMIRTEKESTASEIHVVLNWFEELKERVGSP